MEKQGKIVFNCGNEIFEREAYYKKLIQGKRVPQKSAGPLSNYIPKPTDKLKEVCVNLHFFQKDDGSNNYTDSNMDRIQQIFGWAAEHFSHVGKPSVPAKANNVILITDTRIRLKLHRVEFYQDSKLEQSSSVKDLQKAVYNRDPLMLNQLNIYFTNGYYLGAIGFASLPSTNDFKFDSFVVMLKAFVQNSDWVYSQFLAHEIGHVFDLCHTYLGGGCSANCNQSDPEYLYDVFGTSPSNCPHKSTWSGSDPNNLMGGSVDNSWTSALQAAIIHRALTEKSIRRYVSKQKQIAVWRPSNGSWYLNNNPSPTQWGEASDIPVPADYNGDGKTELAVWRPAQGKWYIHGKQPINWGIGGDIPVPGDYNGVGKAQLVVWRPSEGIWYIDIGKNIQWGQGGDIPVPADYNGDGKLEIAVWRPSDGTWRIMGQAQPIQWGQAGDIPVPADYFGTGKSEIAVWRPSDGTWRIMGQTQPVQWGQAGDIPIPADFLGCPAHAQFSVWRPSNGTWYIYGQHWNDFANLGIGGDIPLFGDF